MDKFDKIIYYLSKFVEHFCMISTGVIIGTEKPYYLVLPFIIVASLNYHFRNKLNKLKGERTSKPIKPEPSEYWKRRRKVKKWHGKNIHTNCKIVFGSQKKPTPDRYDIIILKKVK